VQVDELSPSEPQPSSDAPEDPEGAEVIAGSLRPTRARSPLALLFVVWGVSLSFFLVWALPPFMAADELAHVARAGLLGHGRLVAERIEGKGGLTSGGPVDLDLFKAAKPFGEIMFHPEVKATAERYAPALGVRWTGRARMVPFPTSAGYPPFLYLPVSVGLVAGRVAGLSVVHTLWLARALNALACAAVGAAALQLMGRGRLLTYSLLLLPMSVALYAAATQDGLLIAVSALASALIFRAASAGRPLTAREAFGAAGCIALLGMSKLPYALLGVALIACPLPRPRLRWPVMALAIGLPALWNLWAAVAIDTPFSRGDAAPDAAKQIGFLLSHPGAVGQIAVHTLHIGWSQYAASFIGILGWLDTRLPRPFYPAAFVVLGLALVAGPAPGAAGMWKRLPLLVLVACLLSAGAIFAALYLIWSPVGALMVDGVQGRYFLPIASFVPLAFLSQRPLLGGSRTAETARRAASLIVLGFPLVSGLVVERAVLLRYYLG
jgi:hypothetical protein